MIKEPLTNKANWVNFESDLDKCISQASRTAEIDKKRLILVYRKSIPNTFVQVHLSQRRFDTWKQSHTDMLEQIRNPDFLIQWNADKALRPQMKMKHQNSNGRAQEQHHLTVVAEAAEQHYLKPTIPLLPFPSPLEMFLRAKTNSAK
jgi:hypothetical protein